MGLFGMAETIPNWGKRSCGSQPKRGRDADGACLNGDVVHLDGPWRGLGLALAGGKGRERQGQKEENEPREFVTGHGGLRLG